MEKSEQVWNIILHYAQPLTDDPDSESVIVSSDLNQLHQDIMAVIEGREVLTANVSKTLPVPKPKTKKEVKKEIEEINVPIPDVQTATMVQAGVEAKKPWWKVW